MPSIILGAGSDAIRIDGEVLRVDSSANKIGWGKQIKNTISEEIKSLPLPEDDIYISQIPKAIRDVSLYLASLSIIEVDQELEPYTFYYYSKEVKGYAPFTSMIDTPPYGYAIDKNRLMFSGIVPLGQEEEVGKVIKIAGKELGIVVAPKKLLLTPKVG